MLILQANNLKKYFGDRLIFNIEDLKIYSKDKVGLVGVNGAGKTTLLNILTTRIEPEFGSVKLYGKYSYITQLDDDEYRDTEAYNDNFYNIHKASHEFISEDLKDNSNEELSGGEKTRLKLEQSFNLFSQILFADEPTSNLDIQGIQLLEQKLFKYEGTLIIVSHDRTLLDKLCNKILEIEDGKIKIYNGNYTDYSNQKNSEIELQQFEFQEYKKEKRRLEEAIKIKNQKVISMKNTPSRMGNSEARLHKMGNQSAKSKLENSVKSIKSRIDKLPVKEKPMGIPLPQVDITQNEEIHSKIIINGENIYKTLGSKVIFKNAFFQIYNDKKTALIGCNGAGKTTLIKMIMNKDKNIFISKVAKIGYFNQDLTILNGNLNIIDSVMLESKYPETFVRTLLARLLFKGEDVYKKVKVLSGGERVKVSFAKIFVKDINMLILDEPTNYLDIASTEAIESTLKEYNGTLLLVSHDRKFINTIANKLLIIENKKFTAFDGSYEDYLDSSTKKKISIAMRDIKFEKLVLENRLTNLLSRLSVPSKNDDITKLDLEYKEVLSMLKKISQI